MGGRGRAFHQALSPRMGTHNAYFIHIDISDVGVSGANRLWLRADAWKHSGRRMWYLQTQNAHCMCASIITDVGSDAVTTDRLQSRADASQAFRTSCASILQM